MLSRFIFNFINYMVVSRHSDYWTTFCRSLFVLLYFFVWSLYYVFFDLRLLTTTLVSPNVSLTQRDTDVAGSIYIGNGCGRVV